ncbi:MAG: F0F1 ATP synthase subunit delta [Bacteriovoracaceae bacterium]|nr:F0F1 ATP synthase subunit delta [Bacteriovoracaceae bacterium]
MKESIIAKAYAQSIVDLTTETKTDLIGELTTLTELINNNNDFETVLFMDSFTIEEKSSVVEAVCDKAKFSALTKNLMLFLLNEKRIGLFPMIFKNVIVIDDHNKGFLRGTIEGSEESIPEDVKNKLISYLKSKLGKEPKLEYSKSKTLTAGYRVTVEDLQLDATVDHQLDIFKESVLNK